MSEDGAPEDNADNADNADNTLDAPEDNTDNTLSAPVAPTMQTGPTTPRRGPPKFKQRQTRQFKSKPPKKGVKGFGDDIPGMEGLGTDITVICPWEAFSHLELHELAQFGII
ncbi:retinal cone rhodopsin-sensitive cGMP 3',5'-cyclic phosphodiesterase subunit gamma [Eublepharis macularius]|uniref:Retinal cone rhodopsin-sensitive cGMP 3',5'-cyclic phosphodiesterase subunit gamma n=1 Tax=Eublepharis macularius TaxID=481883 RepID=A0AA97L5S7_EUBMA|nr:retinal cone rhodopsin-sensitive cGMP 3',5'-cyclic phosphodiesterase subunit gamma [Eublepharis macularius]